MVKYMQIKILGFTLVEMLIVIAIISLVTLIAVPAFLNQLKSMEAKSTASDITNFLVNAKQEAMIYHNILTVCMADKNQKCVANQGVNLISFTDKNANRQFDNGIDVMRSFRALNLKYGDVSMNIALGRTYIDFKPTNGTPIGHMGHIKYCPHERDEKRMFKVSFSKTGIIKLKFNKDEKTGC